MAQKQQAQKKDTKAKAIQKDEATITMALPIRVLKNVLHMRTGLATGSIGEDTKLECSICISGQSILCYIFPKDGEHIVYSLSTVEFLKAVGNHFASVQKVQEIVQ